VQIRLEKLEKQEQRPKKDALLYDLGFSADYGTVWNFQKVLLDKRISSKVPDCLVLVEHDHVLTLGRSSHVENILVRGLPQYEIERGGDVTYHGPGQLVAYPIVSLSERALGVRQYIELLESVVSEVLAHFGVSSRGQLGALTGVWVDGKRKIASIGVAASHWVTYHGVALNVNTDLSYFQKIKPCGFESSVMTSLSKELHQDSVEMEEVKKEFILSFSDLFSVEFRSP